MKHFIICLVIVIECFSCTQASNNKKVDTESTAAAVNHDSTTSCLPLRVAIMIDKTGSTKWNRTPTLTTEDFEFVYDVMKQCGGDLGVGFIADESNRGLLRLTIEQPPIKPISTSKESNPFKAAKETAEIQKLLQDYESKLNAWVAGSELKLQHFRGELQAFLTEPPRAPKTDLWGAVARADLFLAEDDSAWGKKTRRFGIVVSDCQDNQGKQVVNPLSGAKWIIVNGTHANLEPLVTTRFESFGSAIRHIMANSGG